MIVGTFSNSHSRHLWLIKTRVNLLFSRWIRKTFSFCDGIVVTCHLHFAKQNSKNVRELLLLSYVNNVVSDSLSFFMTLISPKIPTLITSNMIRSISITSIQPNVKQSFVLKKLTFLALLKNCNCLPLSTVNKGLCSTAWKDCVCFWEECPTRVGTVIRFLDLGDWYLF